jgi:hypothetical protein
MNSLAARLAGSAIDFEHLTSCRHRYGKRRWFFRPFRPKRLSRKWPLPGMPGSAAFNAEYNRLHAMLLDGSLGKTETVFFKGTIGWCIEQWRASDEYKAMQDNTKRGNIRYLDNIKRRMGGALLKHLTPQLVIKFRNEIKATSSADAHVLALGKLWVGYWKTSPMTLRCKAATRVTVSKNVTTKASGNRMSRGRVRFLRPVSRSRPKKYRWQSRYCSAPASALTMPLN